jgi:hypothetical protein
MRKNRLSSATRFASALRTLTMGWLVFIFAAHVALLIGEVSHQLLSFPLHVTPVARITVRSVLAINAALIVFLRMRHKWALYGLISVAVVTPILARTIGDPFYLMEALELIIVPITVTLVLSEKRFSRRLFNGSTFEHGEGS